MYGVLLPCRYLNLSGPANPYAPKDAPAVAFTAEWDGQDAVSIGDSNGVPGSQTPPGGAQYEVPYPGNNTVPDWATKLLRAGFVADLQYCVFAALSIETYECVIAIPCFMIGWRDALHADATGIMQPSPWLIIIWA